MFNRFLKSNPQKNFNSTGSSLDKIKSVQDSENSHNAESFIDQDESKNLFQATNDENSSIEKMRTIESELRESFKQIEVLQKDLEDAYILSNDRSIKINQLKIDLDSYKRITKDKEDIFTQELTKYKDLIAQEKKQWVDVEKSYKKTISQLEDLLKKEKDTIEKFKNELDLATRELIDVRRQNSELLEGKKKSTDAEMNFKKNLAQKNELLVIEKENLLKIKNDLASVVKEVTDLKVQKSQSDRERMEEKRKTFENEKKLQDSLIDLKNKHQKTFVDCTNYESVIIENKKQIEKLSNDNKNLSLENVNLKRNHESNIQSLNQKISDIESMLAETEQMSQIKALQMYELQEEIEDRFFDKQKTQSQYEYLKLRWNRLEKNIPDYLDFDPVRFLSIDNISDTPKIRWQVTNFYQSGLDLPELTFETILKSGKAGIRIIENSANKITSNKDGYKSHPTNASNDIDEGSVFFPYQLEKNPTHFSTFQKTSAKNWRKLLSAIHILDKSISSRWQDIKDMNSFDPGFWTPYLSELIKQIQLLPEIFRYDNVKLKRELNNIDYEHLWLEVHGVKFGDFSANKLEFRVAASLIQSNGFSRHPKFEFPLGDRQQKPFPSWFAESKDDQGPKFEIRFSLDDQAMDLGAIAKLSGQDITLLYHLLQLTPQFIEQLIDQRIPINRPWASWLALTKETVSLIKVKFQGYQFTPPTSAAKGIQTLKTSGNAVAKVTPSNAATHQPNFDQSKIPSPKQPSSNISTPLQASQSSTNSVKTKISDSLTDGTLSSRAPLTAPSNKAQSNLTNVDIQTKKSETTGSDVQIVSTIGATSSEVKLITISSKSHKQTKTRK
jgi:hypothetical protein